MFKPTLKRSKMTPEIFSSSTPKKIQPLSQSQLTAFTSAKGVNEYFIPTAFMESEKKLNMESKERLMGPISSWALQYPRQVDSCINLPLKEINRRSIGAQLGVYWLFIDNKLYLWKYDSQTSPSQLKLERKFEFNQHIYCLAIGKIEQANLQFNFSQNELILALGFQKIIDLYCLNTATLELKQMMIRLKVDYSQTLEKIVINNCNEILYTGDEGYLTRVSLFRPSCKSRILAPEKIMKKTVRPSNSPFFSNLSISGAHCQVITQKILSDKTTNKIYLLVRKERKQSYFNRMTSSFMRFISGRILVEDEKIVTKEIHVFDVKQGQSLVYVGCINNSEIQKRVAVNYAKSKRKANSNKHGQKKVESTEHMQNTIMTIYLSKKQSSENEKEEKEFTPTYLTVITCKGLAIGLKEYKSLNKDVMDFNFLDEPRIIFANINFEDEHPNGVSLLFKQSNDKKALPIKEGNEEEVQQNLHPIMHTFGYENLTILQDGLCLYINSEQVLALKINVSSSVQVIELKSAEKWAMFCGSKILILRKTPLSQIIMTYSMAAEELTKQKESYEEGRKYIKSLNDINSTICKVLGSQKLCEVTCSLLLDMFKQEGKGYQASITTDLKHYAKQELLLKVRKSQSLIKREQKHYEFICEWLLPSENNGRIVWYQMTFQSQIRLWGNLFSCWEKRRWTPADNLEINYNRLSRLGYYSQFLMKKVRDCLRIIKKWSPKYFIKQVALKKEVISDLKGTLDLVKNREEKTEYFNSQIRNEQLEIKLQRARKRQIEQIKLSETNTSLTSANLGEGEMIKVMTNLFYPQGKHGEFLDSSTAMKSEQQESVEQKQTKQVKQQSLQKIEAQNLAPQQDDMEGEIVNSDISSIEQIEGTLKKIIPKILSIIKLYQILGEVDIKEPLPNFEEFLYSLNDRKKIKYAFLDYMKDTDIVTNQTILKINKQLPQIGLDSNIYFSKWLNTIGINKSNRISVRLENTDLQKLGEIVDLDLLVKAKTVFENYPVKYVEVLFHRYNRNQIKLDLMERTEKSIEQQSLREHKDIKQKERLRSLFSGDSETFREKMKVWVMADNEAIKEEIVKYIEEFILKTNVEHGKLAENEKKLNELIKLIAGQSDSFYVEQLSKFLREKSIMPEKIYLLNNTRKQSQLKVDLIEEKKEPKYLSSFALISNSRRKIDEILPSLEANGASFQANQANGANGAPRTV